MIKKERIKVKKKGLLTKMVKTIAQPAINNHKGKVGEAKVDSKLNPLLFGLLDYESTNEFIESLNLNIMNKEGLVIIYGNNNLSLKQIDEIMSYFKTNNDIYYTCPLDNNLGDNEVVLSLLIER